MDETLQTARTYEANATDYCEKYRAGSVAADHGDPFFDALAGPRVLDVGCGPGSDAAAFADRDLDVIGVDVTRAFVAAARDDVPGTFCRGDARSLPFADGAFDGVWSSATLHHLPRDEVTTALAECRRVLAPDGVLFCSVKRGSDAGFEPDHDHGGGGDRYFAYYGGDEFQALLADAGLAGDVRTDGRWVSALAHPT